VVPPDDPDPEPELLPPPPEPDPELPPLPPGAGLLLLLDDVLLLEVLPHAPKNTHAQRTSSVNTRFMFTLPKEQIGCWLRCAGKCRGGYIGLKMQSLWETLTKFSRMVLFRFQAHSMGAFFYGFRRPCPAVTLVSLILFGSGNSCLLCSRASSIARRSSACSPE